MSGPSFAEEVARGLPTALTVAATDAALAATVAALLRGDTLRAYESDDLAGVEVGGAIKNVLAIAAGASDGLGFGHNARAALITRGLAETGRLSAALGGKRETLMGLAGLGDLVLTCTGDLSRNRRVGLGLAQGKRAAGDPRRARPRRRRRRAPRAPRARSPRITASRCRSATRCYRVLHEGLPPRDAVRSAARARTAARSGNEASTGNNLALRRLEQTNDELPRAIAVAAAVCSPCRCGVAADARSSRRPRLRVRSSRRCTA